MGKSPVFVVLGFAMLAAVSLALNASAQAYPEVMDPSGDVAMSGPLPDQQTSTGQFDFVDIIQFGLAREDLASLTFAIKFAQAEAPVNQAPIILQQSFTLDFRIDENQYQITNAGACESGTLQVRLPDGSYRVLACVVVERQASNATLRVQVDKAHILDHNQVPFRQGTALDGLMAQTRSVLFPFSVRGADLGGPFTTPITVTDRAPDVDGLAYVGQVGGENTGALRIHTAIPVRMSNGEETRFLFVATLENSGNETLVPALRVENTPEFWQVAIPPTVEIPPHTSKTIPILVFKSFAHNHGQSLDFDLVATANNLEARQTLSIGFLEIPQPAGHHPVLHFHSGLAPVETTGVNFLVPGFESQLRGWMNTIFDDSTPAATDGPLPGEFGETAITFAGQPIQDWQWTIPLSPALVTGLDFDPGAQAQLLATVRLPTAASTVSIEAVVYHCSEPAKRYTGTPLACPGASSALFRFSDNSSATGTFTTNLFASFANETWLYPYAPGTNLVIQLNVTITPPTIPLGDQQPTLLVSQSTLQLPLKDYIDPFDTYASGLNCTPQIGAPPAPVGETVTLGLNCANETNATVMATATIFGDTENWMEIGSPATVTLEPGENQTFTIRLHPPAEAELGKTSDAALAIFGRDGALLHVQAFTVTASAGVDGAVTATKKTPAGGAWLALAIAAFAVRRKIW